MAAPVQAVNQDWPPDLKAPLELPGVGQFLLERGMMRIMLAGVCFVSVDKYRSYLLVPQIGCQTI